MRIHLLGTVALATLSLATPGFSQTPSPDQGPGRAQERPNVERPNVERPNAERPGAERPGNAERAQERAQERQERAQERQQERQERAQERQERQEQRENRAQDRAQDRSSPAGRAGGEERAPQVAPDRRNADTERPNQPNRPDGQPRAAEPARPAQPQERSAQPARPDGDRADPPRSPRAAEPATPSAPAPQQRDAQPTASRTPAPGAAPAPSTAQPATPSAPTQPQRDAQPTPAPTAPATPPAPSTAQPAAPPAAPAPTARRDAPNEQQRAISETIERQIERREMRPTRDIGVSISVGAALPERVRIDRLPREVVETRPQYRDYGVVVTEEETVIVDPRTRRVVEVIERRGGRRGADEVLIQRIERSDVREWRNPRVEIREDVILPPDAPLAELPGEYVERSPRYRGYRYVSSGDEIAIVEPRSRRVVQVIDRRQARQAQSGSAPATTASTGRAAGENAGLSRDEREEINRTLLQRVSPGTLFGVRDLRGATLPPAIEPQRLPAAVADRSPSLRGMSYVLLGDDVLIVDPESRRVVDVIE